MEILKQLPPRYPVSTYFFIAVLLSAGEMAEKQKQRIESGQKQKQKCRKQKVEKEPARQGKAGSAAISQIVLENGENAFLATSHLATQPAS